MKFFIRTVLIAIALSSKQGASAPISTPLPAINLYAACNASMSNEYARGFCDGAMDALYSSIQDWCVPVSVTHKQVKEIIKHALLDAPPPASMSAFEFVNRTVQKEWPCF